MKNSNTITIDSSRVSHELIMELVSELSIISKEMGHLHGGLIAWMESINEDWSLEDYSIWYNTNSEYIHL
tara:strand:- start:2306 stop:2515 length:210 start_codon:yes stop_codon:yes gene_type:complete